MVVGRAARPYYRKTKVHEAGRAAGPYYRAQWWLVGLQGHTTGNQGSWESCRALLNGHRGGWEGCRAIQQGTMVAGRAAGSYYRAPW